MKIDYRLIHRVVPNIHEDAVGFLIRVAERNHISGPNAVLANITEGRHLSIDTANLPRMAHYCRNYVEELLHLSGVEQHLSDGSRAWQVNGEWVSKSSFISARNVRVCSLCLQKQSYIRGTWSLSFYTACAQHGVRMLEQCPGCGRPLRWDRRRVSYCGCNYDFSAAPVTPVSGPSALMAQLIARRSSPSIVLQSKCIRVCEIEKLALLSLDGLCKTIWFLGHCIGELHQYGTGHGRLQPTIMEAETIMARAVDVLGDWPEGLGERLRALTQRSPSNSSSALLDRLLGPVQHYLNEELQAEELVFVRTAYEQHIRMLWRTFGRRHQLRNAGRQYELDFD